MDRNVDQEKPKGANVVIDVQDGPGDMLDGDLFVGMRRILQDEPFDCNATLSFRQPSAICGLPGHKEGCSQTNQDSEEPLEEENVPPPRNDHAANAPWRNACEAVG